MINSARVPGAVYVFSKEKSSIHSKRLAAVAVACSLAPPITFVILSVARSPHLLLLVFALACSPPHPPEAVISTGAQRSGETPHFALAVACSPQPTHKPRHPERSSLRTLQAVQSKDPDTFHITNTARTFKPLGLAVGCSYLITRYWFTIRIYCSLSPLSSRRYPAFIPVPVFTSYPTPHICSQIPNKDAPIQLPKLFFMLLLSKIACQAPKPTKNPITLALSTR